MLFDIRRRGAFRHRVPAPHRGTSGFFSLRIFVARHHRSTSDIRPGQGRRKAFGPTVQIMAGPPNKRQKREQLAERGDLPKKKFYRQRAHANPFSDHQLT